MEREEGKKKVKDIGNLYQPEHVIMCAGRPVDDRPRDLRVAHLPHFTESVKAIRSIIAAPSRNAAVFDSMTVCVCERERSGSVCVCVCADGSAASSVLTS